MATAQEYAQWIVANKDKRGSPDFETVAKAYEAAKRAEGLPMAEGAPIPTGGPSAPAYTGKDPEMARLQAGGAAPTTAQKVRGAAELLNMPFALAGGVVGGVAGAGEALLTGKPVMDTAALRAGQGAVGMMPIPPTQAGQELMGNIAGSDAVAQLQALGPAGLVSSLGTRAVGAGMSTARQMAPVVAKQALPKVAQVVESVQAGRAVKQAAAAQAAIGAQQTVSAAERLGVPVMTTDVKQPTTFIGRAVQTLGERIPGAGTGGARAEQQTARIDAVRNVLKDYGADDAAALSDDVMRDLSTKRGADLKKYSEMKNGVIDAADAKGPVAVPRTTAAIDAEIAKLSGLNTEKVTPVIAELEDFKKAIQGQGLGNIEELRKQLGKAFTTPELASVRSTAEKAAGRIYGPLKEDMRDAITATGGRRDVLRWEVANKRLSEMSGELGSNALKSALNKGATEPEQVRKLLFSTKPSEVRLLYKNLTPDGRASARAAILQEAAKKAGGDAALSPTRFANEVGRLGESVGVFFTKDDRAAIDGLTRVLNATKRAGEFAANPPSGVQLYPAVGAAALTDIFGGFGAGIVSGLSLGGVARLYESKAVRNMLISMPKTKPGSREEISLVNRILSGMRGVQQLRATKNTRPEDVFSRSSVKIREPNPLPQRDFSDDYKGGSSSSQSGSPLTHDIEGRPLDPGAIVFGRRIYGGMDEGAITGQTSSIAERFGIPVEFKPAKEIGGDAGRFTTQKGTTLDPKIELSTALDRVQAPKVLAHELAHALDKLSGDVQGAGVQAELRHIYDFLNNRQGQSVAPRAAKHQHTPAVDKYAPDKHRDEMWAEAIRLYMIDPNTIKTIAPNVAAKIRAHFNGREGFKNIVQFNSLLGATGAGGAALYYGGKDSEGMQ